MTPLRTTNPSVRYAAIWSGFTMPMNPSYAGQLGHSHGGRPFSRETHCRYGLFTNSQAGQGRAEEGSSRAKNRPLCGGRWGCGSPFPPIAFLLRANRAYQPEELDRSSNQTIDVREGHREKSQWNHTAKPRQVLRQQKCCRSICVRNQREKGLPPWHKKRSSAKKSA